jgi:hypothetical protein
LGPVLGGAIANESSDGQSGKGQFSHGPDLAENSVNGDSLLGSISNKSPASRMRSQACIFFAHPFPSRAPPPKRWT